jgi:uncharacterized membrane protein
MREGVMTTISDDLIKRSADIRWPIGFDPVHADLFAHNAVVINAPARSIWAMLIAADAWPDWYSNASDVVVDDPSGELAEDLTFSWKTFGLTIASQVAEFTPYARLGWRLNGNQLRAYHTWLLVPRPGDSTYVVMEEIGMGEGAQHLMGLDRLARGKLVSEPPDGSTVDTRAVSPMARSCPVGLVRRRTAGGMSCLEH